VKRIIWTVVVVLVLEAAVGLFIDYSGVVNVSAIPPPSRLEQWILGTASDKSVAKHATAIKPIKHDDPALLKLGLEHYNADCVMCHLAPSMKPTDAAKGLNPPPPHLWEDSQDMSDAELYWVVKNGIRMTGMPAFGPTHDDHELRAIVAFIRELPKLKDGKYQKLVQASGLRVWGDDEATPAATAPGTAAPATGDAATTGTQADGDHDGDDGAKAPAKPAKGK
jgi:mono/diheme cytochrome c family protein